jgi:hypothetical protein
MSQPKSDPSYRLHRQSGRGIVTLSNGDRGRKDVLLDGEYDSEQSRAHYYRVLAEWRANGCRLPARNHCAHPDLTVNELMEKYVGAMEKDSSRTAASCGTSSSRSSWSRSCTGSRWPASSTPPAWKPPASR